MPWKYNGKTINSGKPWTDDNGITHPSNWNIWTDSYKVQMGLVWEEPVQDQQYDKRFYYSASVPKALEDVASVDENGDPVLDENGNQIIQKGLKTTWIEKTKETAHSLLTPTDWYEIRKLSKNIDIPANVVTYRDAVIQASNDIEIAISSVTTHDEFVALFDPVVDSNGNYINNAPVYAWPENNIA